MLCRGVHTIKQGVNQGRHRHPPRRCHRRQHQLVQTGQMAGFDFPFDFHPNQKKENRHESIIDPIVQRQGQGGPTHPNAQRDVHQALKQRRPRTVHDDHRGHRREQQHHARCGIADKNGFQALDHGAFDLASQENAILSCLGEKAILFLGGR